MFVLTAVSGTTDGVGGVGVYVTDIRVCQIVGVTDRQTDASDEVHRCDERMVESETNRTPQVAALA